MKNHGVILGERTTDYRAGAKVGALPFIEVRPNGDWENVLPAEEKQYNDNGDSMSCVTFAELNGIETQMNDFLYTGKMSDELIQWSIDRGYLIKRF